MRKPGTAVAKARRRGVDIGSRLYTCFPPILCTDHAPAFTTLCPTGDWVMPRSAAPAAFPPQSHHLSWHDGRADRTTELSAGAGPGTESNRLGRPAARLFLRRGACHGTH